MKQLFSLGLAFALIAPAKSLGDGMFVAPKWAKQKDINEPNQKAIIIYDAGRENMILQVKYEGPLKEFGWLIPVPAVPTVTQGSVKCFYELSQYTQRNFYTDWNLHTWEFPARGRTQSIEHTKPPVTVIETKTVGDYKITILSAKDSGALAFWLKKNRYYFPTNQNNVVDCYLKRHWSFVAVKINLGRSSGANSGLASQLADGELNPLQISFDTGRCIFPLRISSGNGRPSEVQVYVLSPEPLFERAMLEQKLPLIYSNDMAHANRATEWQKTKVPLTVPGFFAADYYGRRSAQLLAQRTEEAEAWTLPDATSDELLPYAKVTTKDLPETARFIPWLAGRTWWLTKQTWNFKPEAMQDLVFEPAIPYFANQLSSKYGYFGAAELAAFETDAVPTVLVALRSPDPAVRINATLALDNPKHPIFDPRVTLTAFSVVARPGTPSQTYCGHHPHCANQLDGHLRGSLGAAAKGQRRRRSPDRRLGPVLFLQRPSSICPRIPRPAERPGPRCAAVWLTDALLDHGLGGGAGESGRIGAVPGKRGPGGHSFPTVMAAATTRWGAEFQRSAGGAAVAQRRPARALARPLHPELQCR